MVTLEQTIKYIIDSNLYHDLSVDTATSVTYTVQDAEIDLATTQHVLKTLPVDTYLNVQAIESMFTHLNDNHELICIALTEHINLIKLEKIL